MNKISINFFLVALSCIGLCTLNSCKDDEPAPKASVSFATSNQIVNEADGTITVQLNLDRPSPVDVIVEYSLSGTATRRTSTNAATADYEIVGSLGEVEILKGESSGTISIRILNDQIYEEDETIIITLDDTDSDRVMIGTRSTTTITIVSDDAQIIASFPTTSLTVNEAASGFHEIVVQLDKPAPSNLKIMYDLSPWFSGNSLIPGIAIDSLTAFNNDVPAEYYDYYIDGVQGELEIAQGETSGVIRVNVLSDFNLEGEEKIEITLKNSPGVTIGSNNKFTITVTQENGRVVVLFWPDNTDVDMDLFVWVKVNTTWIPIIASQFASTDGPEGGIVPTTFLQELGELGYNNLEFGGSYVYYSGTVSPLPFEVQLIDYINGDFEPVAQRDIKTAEYTLANLNPYDTNEGTDIQIVQTWTYANGAYGNVSEITPPASGSRVKSIEIPSNAKRSTWRKSTLNIRKK